MLVIPAIQEKSGEYGYQRCASYYADIELPLRPSAMAYVFGDRLKSALTKNGMTRLTNGFSKKWENLQAAYSLWFAYYNSVPRPFKLRAGACMWKPESRAASGLLRN